MCGVVGVVLLTAVLGATGAGEGGRGGRDAIVVFVWKVVRSVFGGNPCAGVALGIVLVAVRAQMET